MNSETVLDFDSAKVRDIAAKYIRQLRGPHKFIVTKCRPTRTLNQNAYYWGVVLQHVAVGLTDTWGERITPEEAHLFCQKEFNARLFLNHDTGECTASIPQTTTKLDVEEFSMYLDKIIRWAGEYLDVEIPPATTQLSGGIKCPT